MSALSANIARIWAYTRDHGDLQRAHHFLYDLRSPPDGTPQFVVMGINPGETPADWTTCPDPTEETSDYDFHVQAGSGRSAIRWGRAAAYYLDGADYVLAELFFWSSANLGEAFNARFGPLRTSRHLPFCTALNTQLIHHYQPRAVVFPGISCADLAGKLYGLQPVDSLSENGRRLLVHMTDGTRPWLFTKHWTGSFGLTNGQREAIRDYIRTTSQRT